MGGVGAVELELAELLGAPIPTLALRTINLSATLEEFGLGLVTVTLHPDANAHVFSPLKTIPIFPISGDCFSHPDNGHSWNV
jgi:hypothetical protein